MCIPLESGIGMHTLVVCAGSLTSSSHTAPAVLHSEASVHCLPFSTEPGARSYVSKERGTRKCDSRYSSPSAEAKVAKHHAAGC